MNEEWRDIGKAPGYQVSDLGRVRSVDRVVDTGPYPMQFAGKVLSSRRVGKYPLYRLGKAGYAHGHILVLEAFVGPRPTARHEGAHWDGDKQNNRRDNLRWATPEENAEDNRRLGVLKGALNPRAKLSGADVLAMRARRLLGETCAAIARDFPVNKQAVHKIVSGQRWAHV